MKIGDSRISPLGEVQRLFWPACPHALGRQIYILRWICLRADRCRALELLLYMIFFVTACFRDSGPYSTTFDLQVVFPLLQHVTPTTRCRIPIVRRTNNPKYGRKTSEIFKVETIRLPDLDT